MTELTQERLKQLYRLEGNNLIGIIKGSKNFNRPAGCRQERGDDRIQIDGKGYAKHRLITLYKTGVLPHGETGQRVKNKSSAINPLVSMAWI